MGASTNKKRQAAGLCRCGNPPRPGKWDCTACADYQSAYKAKRRADPSYVADENSKSRVRYQALKELLYEHYGRACQCCGETAAEFLSIDHMNPLDSYPSDSPRAGAKLYAWLKRNGFPKGFRTLCMNCNWSLGHFGYCPHRRLTNS